LGKFTTAISDSSFETEVLKSSTPVLVDFWAEWCGPCKAIAPKLEEIGQEMGEKIKIAKIDVDNNQEAPAKFGIRSIPTMILFKGGKAVGQIMGNQPKENIVHFLSQHIQL
jgi:thioredoxin 1